MDKEEFDYLEEIKEEKVYTKPIDTRKSFIVINIIKDELVVKDEFGNGFRFKKEAEHSKVKIGDTVKF